MSGISPGFNRPLGCTPPTGTAPGTLHWLSAYERTRKKFLWSGADWSMPGASFSTDPARMWVLGWRYDSAASSADGSGVKTLDGGQQ